MIDLSKTIDLSTVYLGLKLKNPLVASSSPISSAYISSEARIFLARVNICFSPVDRPFSHSRIARLRTTSASS